MEEIINDFLKDHFLRKITISNNKLNILDLYIKIKDVFSINYNEFIGIFIKIITNLNLKNNSFYYFDDNIDTEVKHVHIILDNTINFIDLLVLYNETYNTSNEKNFLINLDKNLLNIIF